MQTIANGTTVKITDNSMITPTPAPAVGTEGMVMRWTYNVNTIVLAIDVAGSVYWVPQDHVETVSA